MKTHPIREWRKKNGKTLEELAELAGLDLTVLSRIETSGQCSAAAAVRLNRSTGVPLGKLKPDLWGDDD